MHVPPVGVGAAHGLKVPRLDHQREHALRSAERRGRQRRGEARNVADPGRARDLSMSWACQGRALPRPAPLWKTRDRRAEALARVADREQVDTILDGASRNKLLGREGEGVGCERR